MGINCILYVPSQRVAWLKSNPQYILARYVGQRVCYAGLRYYLKEDSYAIDSVLWGQWWWDLLSTYVQVNGFTGVRRWTSPAWTWVPGRSALLWRL